MRKKTFLVLFSSICFSCSGVPEQKHSGPKENEKAKNPFLATKAEQLYESEKYSEAKLCYDTLIKLDSTQGLYYFRRAYSKEKLAYEDPTIDSDYFKAINYNYYRKQSAYLNIGIRHRYKAVFHCFTNEAKIAEYDSSLFFYGKCLRLDPTNENALKEQEQVKYEISLIKLLH